MITEKSCGAIVFTKENEQIKYVIVCSKEGIYGFPKGHTEGAETETETALREVLEETGLSVQLFDGFRAEDTHTFIRNNETRIKHIVYFLGEYSKQIPSVQETELNSVHLVDFDTAVSMFQYESSKRLLMEAHNYLLQTNLSCSLK